jgi:hypothetical protein
MHNIASICKLRIICNILPSRVIPTWLDMDIDNKLLNDKSNQTNK